MERVHIVEVLALKLARLEADLQQSGVARGLYVSPKLMWELTTPALVDYGLFTHTVHGKPLLLPCCCVCTLCVYTVCSKLSSCGNKHGRRAWRVDACGCCRLLTRRMHCARSACAVH
jgi:hypothetical protein